MVWSGPASAQVWECYTNAVLSTLSSSEATVRDACSDRSALTSAQKRGLLQRVEDHLHATHTEVPPCRGCHPLPKARSSAQHASTTQTVLQSVARQKEELQRRAAAEARDLNEIPDLSALSREWDRRA